MEVDWFNGFGVFIVPKRAIFLPLVASLVLAGFVGCAVNPLTGDEELMFFSPDEDTELGRKYAPQVEQMLGGRLPDDNIQGYINDVGQKIARVCHRPDISYSFGVVDADMENALAMPGGYIFITRGLLEQFKSEAQLAAVLAHEVAHVVARDTMAAISRQIGMTALIAAAHVGDAPSDVTRATHFLSGVLTLQYSREDEQEADYAGLSYMIQAGYDPNGMIETMQILEDLQTVRPIEFFSTHPNPENRLLYLEERIERRYGDMGTLKTGRQEYATRVLDRLEKRRENPRAASPEAIRRQ
jgi:predicted Zn-dependent protease